MKTPLAWLNLVHHKGRTAVAAGGIAVAVILIFVQLGFHAAAEATATAPFDALNFDLLLVSVRYVDFPHPGEVPRAAASRSLGVPGIRRVMPLHVGSALWRNPDTGMRRRMLLLGFDPNDPVFRDRVGAFVARHREELEKPDTVVVNYLSRRGFGDLRRGGIETDLGARQVTVAGLFSLGLGFGTDGQALCSDTNLSLILGGAPMDSLSMGLVLLEPGTSAETAAAELRKVLPPDVLALTRRDAMRRERRHWVDNAPLGALLTLGVVIAVGAGAVYVYLMIAADVRGRLHEYAVLQALGYSAQHLSGVVVRQAILLAVVGYVPGFVVSLGLYTLARMAAGISVDMTWPRGVGVLALTAAMCGASGLLAARKLCTTEPAEQFS
jgi:putative ABC transport system permease protein